MKDLALPPSKLDMLINMKHLQIPNSLQTEPSV